MHGTINVAAIMAKHQATAPLAPPTTPRDAEHRQDWLDRLHMGSLQMAYAQYGAAETDEAKDEVRKLWGEILTEALERRGRHYKWLKKVYLPRVRAWQTRMETKARAEAAGDEFVY